MTKYAVIIRHQPTHRPVVSRIIEESNDKAIDNMDHYLFSEAMEHIRRFKKDFVEFKRAAWYIDLIRTGDITPYESKEIEPEG